MCDLKSLKGAWGSALVARTQVSKFSGGLLSPKSMANLDSLGQGPKQKVLFGKRRVAYPIDSLIEWMEERCHFEAGEVR